MDEFQWGAKELPAWQTYHVWQQVPQRHHAASYPEIVQLCLCGTGWTNHYCQVTLPGSPASAGQTWLCCFWFRRQPTHSGTACWRVLLLGIICRINPAYQELLMSGILLPLKSVAKQAIAEALAARPCHIQTNLRILLTTLSQEDKKGKERKWQRTSTAVVGNWCWFISGLHLGTFLCYCWGPPPPAFQSVHSPTSFNSK